MSYDYQAMRHTVFTEAGVANLLKARDAVDRTVRAAGAVRADNDDEHQAAAKHTLREMAHRLDTQDVRVHAKADGLLLINGLGKSRYATFKETLLYRVFGVVPKVV